MGMLLLHSIACGGNIPVCPFGIQVNATNPAQKCVQMNGNVESYILTPFRNLKILFEKQ